MENLFTNDAPEGVPVELVLDSLWRWKDTTLAEAYPPAEYTVVYSFTNTTSGETFDVSAANVNDVHEVSHAPSESDTNDDGDAFYTVTVTQVSSGNSVTLNGEYIKLSLKNPTLGYNFRVLAAIRATIEKTASKEQLQYSVSGVQLMRRQPSELMKLEKNSLDV